MARVSAAEYIWNGPANGAGSWFGTNHWLPVGLPTSLDTTVHNSTTAMMNGGVLVHGIRVNGAGLQGPGPLSVNHLELFGTNAFVDATALNYTNFPDGEFRYEVKQTGNFTGKSFTNVKWENRGNLHLTNMWFLARGSMYTNTNNVYNAQWRNKAGSSMLLNNGNYFTFENKINSPKTVFVNEVGASLVKQGTNWARIDWPLRHEGTIQVQTGRLEFNYAALLDGFMTVQSGAYLQFDNSNDHMEIADGATFEGEGVYSFYGSGSYTNYVTSTMMMNSVARMTNVNFVGAGAIFSRPMHAQSVHWHMPAQFLMGGKADGSTTSSILNMGLFVDSGINSFAGATALNFPPGFYYASNSFRFSNFQGTNVAGYGWLTNALGATVHFRGGPPIPSVRWNLSNNGFLSFDSNIRASFPGALSQGAFGVMELAGNGINIGAYYKLEGRVNGWGSLTSHNASVSCILSPHGSNSPFGQISLRTGNSVTTPFPTNTLVVTNAVLELDLGTPGTTNDYIFVSGPNGSVSGKVNIRARDGFGPGTYPIYSGVTANLRFGTVPSGYRYSFVTNAGQYSVQVTLPTLPVASIQTTNYSGGSNGMHLILNTISNANYAVDFTDSPLLDSWQPWTNVVGDGGPISFPVDAAVPVRIFRVLENP